MSEPTGYLVAPQTMGEIKTAISDYRTTPGTLGTNNVSRRKDTVKVETWNTSTGAGTGTVYAFSVADGWQAISEVAAVNLVSTKGDIDEGDYYDATRYGSDEDGVPTYAVDGVRWECVEVIDVSTLACVDGNIDFDTIWIRVLKSSATQEECEGVAS